MAMPLVMLDFNDSLKCMEYLFRLYDEMVDRAEDLKDKLNESVKEITSHPYMTYLHYIAKSYSALELMNILCKYDEFIQPILSQADDEGRTPLHLAIRRNNVGIAKCLIRCGADVERKNRQKETPIYLAALNGQVEVLKEIFLMRKFFVWLKHLN